MRSILFDHNPTSDFVEVTGDKLHHLMHVVRIEVGEKVLLLDGKGLMTLTTVASLSKRSIQLKVIEPIETQPVHSIDVAIGIPKKDALESCLKQVCELGIRNVYLIRSDYSQMKLPDSERLQSLLVSGVEQSNTPYLPLIHSTDWSSLPYADYNLIALMNSRITHTPADLRFQGRTLLVVGPEGGFSPKELEYFSSRERLTSIRLPTPIMRTPTALSAGVGFLLGRLLD